MAKQNFIVLLICSTFILTLGSCIGNKKTDQKSAAGEVLPDDVVEMRADQQKLAGIDTGHVELRSLNSTLRVNGTVMVAPQNLATVCTPMGGYVESISLIPGVAVQKGQTLAIIENPDFIDIQQDYLEARNRLEFAEAEYMRHSELYKDDVYSQQSVQEVTADYKSTKAQVRALEQKLSLIGINTGNLREEDISRTVPVTAPITGYIKTVNVNIGKYVTSSEVLLEIVNRDDLLLELTLFEKDAGQVAQGQRIRFLVNDETEQHEAVICQTGKSIGSDKTYKVYATVQSVCKNVLPGMYVNAVIETSGNRVTALPSDAIVSFNDKDYIFIFSKDKMENGNSFTEYQMIQVKKGVTDGGYTEVFLPEGFNIRENKVVISGAYNLLSAKKNAGEMAC